jgi:putative intracellular protease/amidase
MKKISSLILLLLPLFLFAQIDNKSKKVLMVVSSYGKDMGTTRPGYEFDEFTQAYLIFKNNQLSVDIASPKGGKVIADKFNKDKAYNKAVLADKAVLNQLENTKPTAVIKPEEYDALYIVGGKGAMFDLPFDPSLQDIILAIYKRKGTVISSVCHGPAAFVNVKDGENYLIKDQEITAFTNIEEDLFGKKWVPEFPFKLEDKLKSRGAIFKQTDFMLSKVTVSGKFVTGQNPFSTPKLAEEVVKLLAIQPVKRTLYKDEKSAYLIQDVLDGKKTRAWVNKELDQHKANYDIEIIAIYGYYKILAAKDDQPAIEKGIELLELISPHYFNQNLQLFLAKTYMSISKNQKAEKILKELIAKDLLTEEATQLINELN